MLLSYLRTAIRYLLRQKGLSFIKIFGLSLGMAACLLIFLFVADELSFDRFHERRDELFRVIQVHYDKDTGKETDAQEFIPPPVGPELVDSVPEIVRQTRFVAGQGAVRHGDDLFGETLTLVDPAFLEMFSFPLVAGDPGTALSDRHRLVLTEAHAAKYFGAEDPLGQTLTILFGRDSQDYIVTGVARDVPPNSSLRFDILIPFENLPAETNDAGILADWHRWFCPLFVQLRPNAAARETGPKLDGFCRLHYGTTIDRGIEEGRDPFTFGLQNVATMHLDARFAGTPGLSTSYLLTAIAIGVLLIACVNFINLSIGSSSLRTVEVGVRKVLGARKGQLLRQFGTETLVISSLSILLALLFTELLLPRFNVLSGKQLSFADLFGGARWLSLVGATVVTGALAGIYPAVVLSSFQPVDVMKGKGKVGGRTTLTKSLVVFQFALSVILGISAFLLEKQVTFMTTKDPGYDSHGLIVVMTQESEPLPSERLFRRFRNAAAAHSLVRGVTASNREFGFFLPGSTLELGGRKIPYRFNRVDRDFLATMKLDLVEGRGFLPEPGADDDVLVVNETFAKELGPDLRMGEALGDPARGFPYDRRIVGIVKDCHYRSLRTGIEPMVLYVGEGPSARRNTFGRIIVRVDADRLQESLRAVESAWKQVSPDKPFVGFTQEEGLEGLYAGEKRWSAIVRHASVLSVLLACLGIYGLTSITLSRRVKEIGIRKVLGAGAARIVAMTAMDFVVLISLANAIAWPIVLLAMTRVLSNFAYRIAIAPHYFFLAWLVSLLIAFLTILYLSAKAALRNPVDSLRYE
jgi:putative ABC transport system permease protein